MAAHLGGASVRVVAGSRQSQHTREGRAWPRRTRDRCPWRASRRRAGGWRAEAYRGHMLHSLFGKAKQEAPNLLHLEDTPQTPHDRWVAALQTY